MGRECMKKKMRVTRREGGRIREREREKAKKRQAERDTNMQTDKAEKHRLIH